MKSTNKVVQMALNSVACNGGQSKDKLLAIYKRELNKPGDKVEFKKVEKLAGGFETWYIELFAKWHDEDREDPFNRLERAINAGERVLYTAVEVRRKIANDGSVTANVQVSVRNVGNFVAANGVHVTGEKPSSKVVTVEKAAVGGGWFRLEDEDGISVIAESKNENELRAWAKKNGYQVFNSVAANRVDWNTAPYEKKYIALQNAMFLAQMGDKPATEKDVLAAGMKAAKVCGLGEADVKKAFAELKTKGRLKFVAKNAVNAVARNNVMLPADIQGACAMWRKNVKDAWVAAKNCDSMADAISKWFAGLSAEDKKHASKLIEKSIAPMAAERSFLRKAWGVIEF